MRGSIVVVKVRIDRPAERDGVQPGQLLLLSQDQRRQLLQRLPAVLRRESGPGGECCFRGGDGPVDIVVCGFGDLRDAVSDSGSLGLRRNYEKAEDGCVPLATSSLLYGEKRSNVAPSDDVVNCMALVNNLGAE